MLRLFTVTGSLIVVALLVSCGGGSATPSLDGTSWKLTHVGQESALPGGMISFANAKLSGSTGCNSFGGTYTQSGSSLTIDLGGSTMIGCPLPQDRQERSVFAGLTRTRSFTNQSGTLTLLDGDGSALLTYSQLSAALLVGPTWQVTGINNGKEAVVSTLGGTTVTATFAKDGTLTGSAGCNNYSAGYELSGDTVHIDPPAATRKLCSTPAGVMEQETAYLTALETVTQVEVSGNSITLRDASGATQVTLAAAE